MLFVDEPEVNLHPKAIVLFAEMLHEFAQSGIQVYLTTHSYFLLKRLEQLAREKRTDYSLLDLRKQDGNGVTGTASKLAEGLPENPIVEESLFRGVLFRHLRGTVGVVLAALGSAFVFGIIHPVPVLLTIPLMALGFNFALMREWRGSLLAPMTAHYLHNATVLTLLISVMSVVKD